MLPRFVTALLQRGADIHRCSDTGATLLHVMAREVRHDPDSAAPDVIRILIENGLDPMERDSAGQLPADYLIGARAVFHNPDDPAYRRIHALKVIEESMLVLEAHRAPPRPR